MNTSDNRVKSTVLTSMIRARLSAHDAWGAADKAAMFPCGQIAGDIHKSAVSPHRLTELPQFLEVVEGYLQTLGAVGVYDAMLTDMQQLPLSVNIGAVVTSADGAGVEEGEPIPVSKLELQAGSMEPVKAAALLVFTKELVEAPGSEAQRFIEAQTRTAVAAATDRAFYGIVLAGASSHAGGSDPAIDLRTAAGALVHHDSVPRLYVIVSPVTALRLSLATTADGLAKYPEMSPAGGQIQGLRVLVSAAVDHDSNGSDVYVIDASRVAASRGYLDMAESKHASVQMSTTPSDGPAELVSMWQTNSVALRLIRYFSSALPFGPAAHRITGVSW